MRKIDMPRLAPPLTEDEGYVKRKREKAKLIGFACVLIGGVIALLFSPYPGLTIVYILVLAVLAHLFWRGEDLLDPLYLEHRSLENLRELIRNEVLDSYPEVRDEVETYRLAIVNSGREFTKYDYESIRSYRWASDSWAHMRDVSDAMYAPRKASGKPKESNEPAVV